MTTNHEILADRGCIEISGADRSSFLQGLITNDVEGLKSGEAAFAALLSPQGKILFDFLAVKTENSIWLDCLRSAAPQIVKRFGFYKLRADVTIKDMSDCMQNMAFWGASRERQTPLDDMIVYRDPRFEGLGSRAIAERGQETGSGGDQSTGYETHRIAAGVPECGVDYLSGDVFPHDACLDLLHGVDFKKGCYVGQEVVSRMQHRGTARTRVLNVRGAGGLPVDRPDITAGGFTVGKLGAVAGTHGIALVRLDRVKDSLAKGETLKAGAVDITVSVPKWASYSLND